MVHLTRILGYAARAQRKYLRSGFVDRIRFHVKAGTGGSGLSKYGGVGGRGGDVYVRAKEGYTLKDLASHVKEKTLVATTGCDSTKKGILGANGEDLIINVPPGVIIYHENGTKIGEVDKPDKKVAIALGGVGGCKETDYSGQQGESHAVILDLKLISDVALVGFPNAGKSTLMKTISTGRPKVADYPFTTVRPHLGKILYPDLREISITDLPGLIEGAHKNVGMGHSFLKHLERSKLLLLIIDIQGFQLSYRSKRRNCLETILLLNKEIELYNPELLNIPAMLVLNKMDTNGAQALYTEFLPMIENLKEHASNFDEDMCPDKFLEFENILTMSLIKKDKAEISKLKEVIRIILDKIYEEENKVIEEEIPELKLVEKLRRQLKLDAPVLV